MQDIEGEIERLQAAIIALEGQRQVLGDEIVDTSLGALREKLGALETAARPEQRKLATILFADIVGSTRLSQQIGDPEKMLEVIDGALRRLALPVAAAGGRVLRFMGDGFLAAFGLPQAHEDDAERAVRAGLAILQAANEYAAVIAETHGVAGFAVRVGVNTGQIASGGFSEAANTIMGLDVNLAARLESAAPPRWLAHLAFHLSPGSRSVRRNPAGADRSQRLSRTGEGLPGTTDQTPHFPHGHARH